MTLRHSEGFIPKNLFYNIWHSFANNKILKQIQDDNKLM